VGGLQLRLLFRHLREHLPEGGIGAVPRGDVVASNPHSRLQLKSLAALAPPRALRVQVVGSPAPWERLDLRVRMADEVQRPPPKVDTIGTTQRVIAAERVPEVFAQITVDGHGSPLL